MRWDLNHLVRPHQMLLLHVHHQDLEGGCGFVFGLACPSECSEYGQNPFRGLPGSVWHCESMVIAMGTPVRAAILLHGKQDH